MKKIKSIVLGVLLIVSILAIVNPVSAATLEVGPGKTHATINAAVAAAFAGDTILVYPGTYNENITIDKSLTLQGVDKDTTIVKPSANAFEWITINTSNVHLKNLTFDGDGYIIRQAITTRGSGSISNCIIKNIDYTPTESYQGYGIYIHYGTAGQDWEINGNKFENIKRIGVALFGVEVSGPNNKATISNNIFLGNGDGDWVEYAIQVEEGGLAYIDGNNISNYRGVVSIWGSAGILVSNLFGQYAANPKVQSTAYITGNTITNNTTGVTVGYVDKDTPTDNSMVTLKCNNIFNNKYRIQKVAGTTVNELPCPTTLPMNKFVSIFKKNFEKKHGKSENSNNIEN